eukprot:5507181-Prymnesium_polylepis.1
MGRVSVGRIPRSHCKFYNTARSEPQSIGGGRPAARRQWGRAYTGPEEGGTRTSLRSRTILRVCFAYAATTNNLRAYEKFRERAMTKRDVLFVVIADECHWGIVLGGAHDCFVNDCYENSKRNLKFTGELLGRDNMLSLLVSATPFNVLASPTYIKPENVVEWFKEDESSGKYVRLEDYMWVPDLGLALRVRP